MLCDEIHSLNINDYSDLEDITRANALNGLIKFCTD